VPDLFSDVCEGRPVRFVVDAKRSELLHARAINYWQAPDFPAVNPRRATQPYSDFWMLGISATGLPGRKFFDQLVHADWSKVIARAKPLHIYQAPPKQYLGGEPIFIGDPDDETVGAVICQIFDAERVSSALAVFDAFDVARGPVATLRLREPIHLGFHASFK
jgi:carotenoid cleavage dioxygenase-like enzyme